MKKMKIAEKTLIDQITQFKTKITKIEKDLLEKSKELSKIIVIITEVECILDKNC